MTTLTIEGMMRQETDPAVIANLIRKGWTETTPLPEPEPEPEPVAVITPRQLRLYLLSIGQLDEVESLIISLPGAEGHAARIEWEYSMEVRRSHHLTSAVGQLLGLDSDALDEAFNTASTL